MTFNLYPHQIELIKQARDKFKQGNHSVLIQSPAGSGKSVMIADVVKNATKNNGFVLFMVHRKELVDQIIETLKANDTDMSKVNVMTVGKIKNRLEKLTKPTLIITDETHHGLAKTYIDIYKYYKDIPRLGFTATPWRLNGDGLGSIYDEMVIGKSVEWLIDNGYLAPYKYYSVPLIDKDKLKKSSTGDYTKESMENSFDDTKFYGDVVKTYLEKANGTQAIVYAPTVEMSKLIAEKFSNNGIKAIHADATTPKAEREQLMTDFKTGKIKILCNVDLISEGFNVPDCQTVILCRPTKSLVVYIQQSMRSMRYKPNKQAIIIDHVANYKNKGFGLPDTPHEWTLKNREKNKKADDLVDVKECDNCYRVIKAFLKICPYCGYEFTENEKEDKWDRSVELTEINKQDFNFIVTKDWRKAKSKKELYDIAKAKGYKPGWAFYKAKQLNLN